MSGHLVQRGAVCAGRNCRAPINGQCTNTELLITGCGIIVALQRVDNIVTTGDRPFSIHRATDRTTTDRQEWLSDSVCHQVQQKILEGISINYLKHNRRIRYNIRKQFH